MVKKNPILHPLTLPLLLAAFILSPGAAAADPPGQARQLPDLTWVGEGGDVHFLGGGGFLGVQAVEITPELRLHFGAPEDQGVLIGKVVEDSPAQKAGVLVGDILTALNGKSINSQGQLVMKLLRYEEGDLVSLDVTREGHQRELSATLSQRSPEAGIQPNLHFLPRVQLKGLDSNDLPHGEWGTLEGMGEDLSTFFASPRWTESMEQLQGQRESLQERLGTMEKRLKELEGRLEALAGAEE